MRKILIDFLAVLLAVLACSCITACNSSSKGLIYKLSADNKYAEVIGYEGSSSKVTILGEYEGKPVKSIAAQVFRDNASIVSVTIPESVDTISERAFYGCSNLESITLKGDTKLETIGEEAFLGCDKLMTDEDNLRYLRANDNDHYILYEALDKNLHSYAINENVKILASCFAFCSKMLTITIPDGVKTIGYRAFYNCDMINNVVVPASVTTIGRYAFYWCTALTNINYKQTKAEWKKVTKGGFWWHNSSRKTVTCIDGVTGL